jgi:hypothetical protein
VKNLRMRQKVATLNILLSRNEDGAREETQRFFAVLRSQQQPK